jgi:hypothetical protein
MDSRPHIPTKFEPKHNNRWILFIEGIEPYLIKSVVPPVFVSLATYSHEIPVMTVELHNICGGGTHNRSMLSWISV